MDPAAAAASAAARRQAGQYIGVAEKLLTARDLEGCKEFVSQALVMDPRAPGADDLLAAANVLLAAQRRRVPNGKHDPYAVLGLDPADPASRRPDVIHSSYRRLALLLNRSHPDRPCSLYLAEAGRLVAESWAFLSDPLLKSALDADLASAAAAAAAAAAARVYRPPVPMQHPPQPPPPSQPTPPRVAPKPTPPPMVAPQPTPPPMVAPQPTPPPMVAPQPTPPPRVAPQPTPPPRVAPQPTPPPMAPQPTPPPMARQPTPPTVVRQPTPPRVVPPQPAARTAPPVDSGAPRSATFWTVCTACCHIHQYDRLYETRRLMCPSCRQPFVGEPMAEEPPIVPGTDMYYCTWGFFPVGFPGCPGFEKLVNSKPQGTDQVNAPSVGATGAVEGNVGVGVGAENGPSVSAAVEKRAVPVPVRPMRIKVGAKKRGRPKGSKNKKNL